ncbi:polarized growth boi2 [Trichoderma arundinaceum]|uniref:Polarized growth boi2 n=1 Tax=Trichoderma arundinaceum TaxID=490622 RepID=A0A395N9N9_TRIAR|nr:polarized growth boi2 [Trichoderma arundinaceum]
MLVSPLLQTNFACSRTDDFPARNSDELSLRKGDRVELLERDDEFGDGWFRGRHVVNNKTGLFPECYTRPTPTVNAFASANTSIASLSSSETPSTIPIQLPKDESQPAINLYGTKSSISALEGKLRTTGEGEVLCETLNAIDEHITSSQSPPGTSVINAAVTDSGTEYSVEVDLRISYGQAEETDETDEVKEESGHTHAKAEI